LPESTPAAPAGDAVGPGDREQRPDRLVALSDGIFAIAMTLLVLDISVPSGLDHTGFRRFLGETWPHLGAYALSFGVISGIWHDHHRIFRLVHRADGLVTRLTLVLLGLVALLPFPTALLADYGGEPAAVAVYAATVGLINVLLLALFLAVEKVEDVGARAVPDRAARGTAADFAGTALIAGASILIALTFSADAGLLTWLAVIPLTFAARWLQHHPSRRR
jgi:uncharacterized membrane protein